MYILVIGGGQIGYHLAKSLVARAHEVLILERDRLRCDGLIEELGNMVFRGDGCEAVTLESAGAARADIVIATTGEDEDNLVACQVSKHKFGVPRTVCIVSDPRNETLFQKLGINVTVSATQIILSNIEHQLPEHPLLPLLGLDQSGFELVSVKIPGNRGIADKRLGDISLPTGSIVSMVINGEGVPQAPASDLVLSAEDEVIAVTALENEEMLRAAFTGENSASPG